MTCDSNKAVHPDSAEVAAHAILELISIHPGRFGRLRASRLVTGYAVPLDTEAISSTERFSGIIEGWTIKDAVDLADALLSCGLLAQTTGVRPTLVLTRAGHRALDALQPDCSHQLA